MKTTRLILAGLLAVLATGSAMAQQNTIKFGLSNVQPHATSSDFVSGGFTPPGISLDVLNKNTASFSYTREISDQWDVELAVGAPPTHDIVLKINNPSLPGSAQALNGQVGAKVRQVAPTLFANYKFLEKSSPLRPFIGVGINFTRFDNTSSTAAGNALNGGPHLHRAGRFGGPGFAGRRKLQDQPAVVFVGVAGHSACQIEDHHQYPGHRTQR